MCARKLNFVLQITLVVLCPVFDLAHGCGECTEHLKAVDGDCAEHSADEDWCSQLGEDRSDSPCEHDCPYEGNHANCFCKAAVSSTGCNGRVRAAYAVGSLFIAKPAHRRHSASGRTRNACMEQSASAFALLSGWEIRALIGSLII
jgi:hypothetical protein